VLHFVLELKPKPTRKYVKRRGNHHVFQLTLHKGPIWRYLMSLWGQLPHFQVTSKYAHASTERSESACHLATNAKLSGHWGEAGGGSGGFMPFFKIIMQKSV
jgi:hypothetical protein